MFTDEAMCISVGTTEHRVDPDTLVVEACVDEHGRSASLISLPLNDTNLWEYILTLVSP